MATATSIGLVTGSKEELVKLAQALPVDPRMAIALPLGGSTIRAWMVDRFGNVMGEVEFNHPERDYVDLTHTIAAVLLHFGYVPKVCAINIAGPVPESGPLKITNVGAWEPFDRNELRELFGFTCEWFNDGPAGYFGVPHLSETDFVTMWVGAHLPGNRRGYAIWGRGLNFGTATGREDGHTPFAAVNDGQWEYHHFLAEKLGYNPDWEDACGGGSGFRNAGEWCILNASVDLLDPFALEFEAAAEDDKGKVVTKYAKQGHAVAARAAAMVIEVFGTWLGSMAVGAQVKLIDISEGIFGKDADLRTFALQRTNFLGAFRSQGRPMFANQAAQCTIRVCLRNPESFGAMERASELLLTAV